MNAPSPAPTIRLSRSCVGEEEIAALARVIRAGYLGMGSEVQKFEEELKAWIETDMSVTCVNTGTAALHLAMEALDIGPGDEVLVPSITYLASFQAVTACGATPIPCDVTLDRAFIDLDDARKRVTPRTRAIMPVHYGSDSQGMDMVYAFAHEHGLRVVEDAAHGFGCSRNGRKIGQDGDILCFSFDGIKNITSGEGGAVVTGDEKVAQRVRDARLLAVEKDSESRYSGQRTWLFDVHHQGYRYHMSNLMAAIGREQLKKLGSFSARRRHLVARYRSLLAGAQGLRMLDLDYDNIVPHIFVLRILGGRRDLLARALKEAGIESGIHYQANHLLSYFNRGYALPASEVLLEQIISIPLHAMLTDEEQDRVVRVVLQTLEA